MDEHGSTLRRADRLAARRRRARVTSAMLGALALLAGGAVLLLVFLVARGQPLADPSVAQGASCAEGALRVTATDDTAGVLTQLAAQFSSDTPGQRCAVEVTAAEPAGIAAQLAEDGTTGDAAADVWIPDASVWLRQVEASPQGSPALPAEAPSIARSPTVVAMPQPMAEALGWPGAQLGWSQLAGLAQNPSAWADAGHPEWGPFRLGLPDPTRSAAGLHAVLSVGAAQSQVWTDALTSDGLRDPDVRATLLALERATASLRAPVDEQLSALRAAGDGGDPLGVLAALPTAERDVWRYNRELDGQAAPEVPLAAVYPSEGGLTFDHPFVVLSAAVEAGRDEAAAAFRDFLLGDEAQEALRTAGFRGADNTPGEDLRASTGLAPERAGADVGAPEGRTVAAALESWRAISTRLNTFAVFDVSGSMAEPIPGTDGTRLDFVVDTAVRGSALFADDSFVALWEFSTDLEGGEGDGDYRELVPLGPVGDPVDGAPRRQRLVEALQGLEPANDTALYDTLLAAYIAARDAATPARPSAVALLTDGRSDGDDLTLDELLERLAAEQDPARPVRLAVIAFGEDPPVEELTAVTDLVGGKVFTPTTPEGIAQVFLEILTIP